MIHVEPKAFVHHAEAIIDHISKRLHACGPEELSGPELYTGVCGIAHTLMHTYTRRVNADEAPSDHARRARRALAILLRDALPAARADEPVPTFLCGQPGVYAVTAVTAQTLGETAHVRECVASVREFARARVLASSHTPCELLFGRAGFLYAVLYVNHHIGPETIPVSEVAHVIADVMRIGRAGGAAHGTAPLMFEWHRKTYNGAAHGLSGICHILLHFPLADADLRDVLGTLRYLIRTRYASGNYPAHDGAPASDDRLVHWCHGATGVTLALCKAYEVTGDREFVDAAREAAEVVWKRGLLRKLSLCHGVAGNMYAFLAVRRAEKLAVQRGHSAVGSDARWLHRATAFATFLLVGPPPYPTSAPVIEPPALGAAYWQRLVDAGQMHGGDRSWSLFEGAAGVAHALLDITQPDRAAFPAFELPPR